MFLGDSFHPGNYVSDKSSKRQFSSWAISREILSRGSYHWGNYPGAVNQGAIIWGAIILGGNYPGGQFCSGEQWIFQMRPTLWCFEYFENPQYCFLEEPMLLLLALKWNKPLREGVNCWDKKKLKLCRKTCEN